MPVSKERVYLDKDGNPTRDASAGERLLVAKGAPITSADAEKYGIDTAEGDEAKELTNSHQVLKRASEMDTRPLSFPAGPTEAAPLNVTASGASSEELTGDDSPAKGRVFGDGAPDGDSEKASKKASKKTNADSVRANESRR